MARVASVSAYQQACDTEPPDTYLDMTNARLYMEDALTQLVLRRQDEPMKALQAYFTRYTNPHGTTLLKQAQSTDSSSPTPVHDSVLDGTNVIGREFAYVQASIRNRLAFYQLARFTLTNSVSDEGSAAPIATRLFCKYRVITCVCFQTKPKPKQRAVWMT